MCAINRGAIGCLSLYSSCQMVMRMHYLGIDRRQIRLAFQRTDGLAAASLILRSHAVLKTRDVAV